MGLGRVSTKTLYDVTEAVTHALIERKANGKPAGRAVVMADTEFGQMVGTVTLDKDGKPKTKWQIEP